MLPLSKFRAFEPWRDILRVRITSGRLEGTHDSMEKRFLRKDQLLIEKVERNNCIEQKTRKLVGN